MRICDVDIAPRSSSTVLGIRQVEVESHGRQEAGNLEETLVEEHHLAEIRREENHQVGRRGLGMRLAVRLESQRLGSLALQHLLLDLVIQCLRLFLLASRCQGLPGRLVHLVRRPVRSVQVVQLDLLVVARRPSRRQCSHLERLPVPAIASLQSRRLVRLIARLVLLPASSCASLSGTLRNRLERGSCADRESAVRQSKT